MKLPALRAPLPTLPIADLIKDHDTTAQTAENRRRIHAYLDKLREERLGLPCAPHEPNVLGIAQVAKEAGVSLGVLRSGHPMRRALDEAIPELGLVPIIAPKRRGAELSIADCQAVFLSAAPGKALEAGLKPEVMEAFVLQMFGILRVRAGPDDTVSVRPLIAELQQDARKGFLELPHHVLTLIRDFDAWLSAGLDPVTHLEGEAVSALAFPDLLQLGMARLGLSQSEAAAVVGTKQTAVGRWLSGERVPNERSHAGLRKLACLFGFPDPDLLVRTIIRKRPSRGVNLALEDFPEEYRGKNFKGVRDCVASQITDADLNLPAEAWREQIRNLCHKIHDQSAPNRRRKAMRDANAIDRNAFPCRLREDLDRYRSFLRRRRRKLNTQDSYIQHLEGFFGFVMSDSMKPELRVANSVASIAHAGSRLLWTAYFEHLEETGRRICGDDFRICRSLVERMKSVQSMFDDERGFIPGDQKSMEALEQLAPCYFPHIAIGTKGSVLLTQIERDMSRVRKTWLPMSRSSRKGRDEIADLLSREDPMIAIYSCLDFLRKRLKKTRKWQASLPGGPRRLNLHYAIGLRSIVLFHLLGQTALRIGMFPELTVGVHPHAHLEWQPGKKPHLVIPAKLFKNSDSEVFKEGPYERTLKDIHGCYDDLREYLEVGRPRLLDNMQSDRLLLVWSKASGAAPTKIQPLRNLITEITRDAVGIGARAESRLISTTHLRPHHFRDILATAVLNRTGNYALAADAIHVTEKTAREYYAHDSVKKRRPALEAVFDQMEAEKQERPSEKSLVEAAVECNAE